MSKTKIIEDVPWFVRIANRNRLEDFRNKGEIFMNTIKYFRESEKRERKIQKGQDKKIKNNPKNDSSEGSFMFIKETKMEITPITPNSKPLNIKAFNLKTFNNDWDHNPVFCLYGLDYSVINEPCIDLRNSEFGDSFIFIHNQEEFIKRIQKSLGNIFADFQKIDYYSKSENHNNLTPFDKPDDLSYQNEWRVWIQEDYPEGLKIEIGSIEDITTKIYDISCLKSVVLVPADEHEKKLALGFYQD